MSLTSLAYPVSSFPAVAFARSSPLALSDAASERALSRAAFGVRARSLFHSISLSHAHPRALSSLPTCAFSLASKHIASHLHREERYCGMMPFARHHVPEKSCPNPRTNTRMRLLLRVQNGQVYWCKCTSLWRCIRHRNSSLLVRWSSYSTRHLLRGHTAAACYSPY